MTKRELVMEISDKLGFTQNEVSDVVQATLDTITDSLAKGHRLEIRNFGVFEIKKRDARVGRNPRTGEEVPIEQKSVATFKPGKALKEWVQAGRVSEGDLETKSAASSVTESSPPAAKTAFSSPPSSAGEQGQLF